MIDNIKKLETYLNSELSSKIRNSLIENNELLIEVDQKDLVHVIQFLKSDDKCKFRQLIDIAGVDYPSDENRFELEARILSSSFQRAVVGEPDPAGGSVAFTALVGPGRHEGLPPPHVLTQEEGPR